MVQKIEPASLIDCPVHGQIEPVALSYKDKDQEVKWPMCGLCYTEAVKEMVMAWTAKHTPTE